MSSSLAAAAAPLAALRASSLSRRRQQPLPVVNTINSNNSRSFGTKKTTTLLTLRNNKVSVSLSAADTNEAAAAYAADAFTATAAAASAAVAYHPSVVPLSPEAGVVAAHNLILIGGRGSGKSSVCRRLLAADKRFKLFCLDDMIVYEAGMSIPQIVEKHGWHYFRDLEYEVCRKAGAAFDGWTLIDAGGGVMVDLDKEGNELYSARKIDALKRGGVGKVVYVKRDVDYLMGRIAGDTNRPSLSDQSSFKQIMDRRDPWYLQAADFVVEGGGAAEAGASSAEGANLAVAMKKKHITRKVMRYFFEQTGEQPSEESVAAGYFKPGWGAKRRGDLTAAAMSAATLAMTSSTPAPPPPPGHPSEDDSEDDDDDDYR
eukprot:CAMPEP_0197578006 /NCGR_PEP_ID=MMETSP1326-20131121/2417_1 /TAXON_ID=1155430 /ORGANISM="Genus nov. species nov., Strain RCC2288" /LENGTH=372 /DNA_ID=CAMNT_0043141153 /DNA_START=216 /DNA_END=1334 /DNA_ORIENTATION=-